MKSFFQFFIVGVFSLLISCESDDAQIPNYISVKIDGVNHTFIGRSIYEPVSLLSDTLEGITFLGGYIGSCNEGSDQLLGIEISENSPGVYNLADGTIQFQLELENRSFIANEDSENSKLRLTINEDENGRITGVFSGELQSKVDLVNLEEGKFSLQRLPQNSNVLEIALELCK